MGRIEAMTEKKVIAEKIKKEAPKGKISCHDARQLAQEFKVEPEIIGAICNELKIKVCSCELGCF
jgi:hypothetical protein